MPAVLAFATALNVALASWFAQREIRLDGVRRQPLGSLARVCGIVTFLLELPCFWYAIAIGLRMKASIPGLWRGEGSGDIWLRVRAYVIVILPLLAVSALAEAYAVTQSLARQIESCDFDGK